MSFTVHDGLPGGFHASTVEKSAIVSAAKGALCIMAEAREIE